MSYYAYTEKFFEPVAASYYCPHRRRLIDLSVTFHGPIKKRPAAGYGPELIEALRDRSNEYKRAYYEGGYRITLDKAPCRVAGHVKDWSSRSRSKISSYLTQREHNQISDLMK